MVSQSLAPRELYLYSADDHLCDVAKVDELIERRRAAGRDVHAHRRGAGGWRRCACGDRRSTRVQGASWSEAAGGGAQGACAQARLQGMACALAAACNVPAGLLPRGCHCGAQWSGTCGMGAKQAASPLADRYALALLMLMAQVARLPARGARPPPPPLAQASKPHRRDMGGGALPADRRPSPPLLPPAGGPTPSTWATTAATRVSTRSCWSHSWTACARRQGPCQPPALSPAVPAEGTPCQADAAPDGKLLHGSKEGERRRGGRQRLLLAGGGSGWRCSRAGRAASARSDGRRRPGMLLCSCAAAWCSNSFGAAGAAGSRRRAARAASQCGQPPHALFC